MKSRAYGRLALASFAAFHLTLKLAGQPWASSAPVASPLHFVPQALHPSVDARALGAYVLEAEDGASTTVHQQAARHRLLALVFSESWCVPCRQELPQLQALADAYPAGELGVALVYADSSDVAMQQLQQGAGTHLAAWRGSQAAAQALGIHAVPTVLLLRHDGRLVRTTTGIDAGLAASVRAHLAHGPAAAAQEAL